MSEECGTTRERLIIVGAGFSATTLLAQLSLDRFTQNLDITVLSGGSNFDSRTPAPLFSQAGRGVAYGVAAQDEDLLLNVPVGKMSLYEDRPSHFGDWLRENHQSASESDFVPRALYGKYLHEEFQRLASAISCRVLSQRMKDWTSNGQIAKLTLDSGEVLFAEHLVLATGYRIPRWPQTAFQKDNDRSMNVQSHLAVDRVVVDPFQDRCWAGAGANQAVVVLGTGLTAVDLILRLSKQGVQSITAISRRGQLPHSHVTTPKLSGSKLLEEKTLRGMCQQLRREAHEDVKSGKPWQTAMDRIRTITAPAWIKLPSEDRARFNRHLRPYWDSHRHRLPPETSRQIEGLQREGRLTVLAGRLLECELLANGQTLQLEVQLRSEHKRNSLHCDWLLNATGYEPNSQAAIKDPLGRLEKNVFVLGPGLKSFFWEMTAVPDLRAQSARLTTEILQSPQSIRPNEFTNSIAF